MSTHEERAKANVREACEWFQSFYVTPFMYDSGDFKVYKREEPWVEESEKKSELYSYEEDKKRYEKDLEDRKKYAASDFHGPPAGALEPPTYSFANGALYEYEEMHQVHKFDDTTLFKIVVAHTDPIGKEIRHGSRDDFVHLVNEIIKDELDTAEMELVKHPVMELTSGILCVKNWKWLSSSDLAKWAVAHGAHESYLNPEDNHHRSFMVNHILDSQIKMLQEMVDKNTT
jgi:hypothetical protein